MYKSTKFIFITGGVLSSLGKGLSAASIRRVDGMQGPYCDPTEDGPLHQR